MAPAAQPTPRAAAVLLTICLAWPFAPLSAQQPVPRDNLAALDLEELGRIEVTSTDRKPVPLAEASAAITVITREDIRRSGAASLPEVLRLVPGLEVARTGGRDWAVSARGFNEEASNKLLLLVDGRTAYSPIFARVFWDVLMVPLGHIDRIEVIRGPGATLWGANAVNGVINIITKPADETPGGRVALGGGTWDRFLGNAQYGGRRGTSGAFRVYGAGRVRDGADQLDGSDAGDDWQMGQIGFRYDGGLGSRDRWSVQGDAYAGAGGGRVRVPVDTAPYAEFLNEDQDMNGGNILARWTRTLGPSSSVSIQTFYDRSRRTLPAVFGRMTENLFDVELQHRFPLFGSNDILWSVGYRLMSDEVTGGRAYGFVPDSRTSHLFTGFVQDEITLMPERFRVTLGTKVEHNSFTGFEVMPNVRLLWTPHTSHALWAAVSRAVRTPARVDLDADATSAIPNLPFKAILAGNEDFESEDLLAWEAGYRVEPSLQVALDFNVFYNDYRDLRVLAPDSFDLTTTPRPTVIVTLTNQAKGHTAGAEVAATWRLAHWLRARGTYAWLDRKLELEPGAPNGSSVGASMSDPEHQVTLWTSIDLPARTELDVIVRHVSALESGVDDYTSADVRIGWTPIRNLSLSLVGQDLFHTRHQEFPPSAFTAEARAIPRRAWARVAWQF